MYYHQTTTQYNTSNTIVFGLMKQLLSHFKYDKKWNSRRHCDLTWKCFCRLMSTPGFGRREEAETQFQPSRRWHWVLSPYFSAAPSSTKCHSLLLTSKYCNWRFLQETWTLNIFKFTANFLKWKLLMTWYENKCLGMNQSCFFCSIMLNDGKL